MSLNRPAKNSRFPVALKGGWENDRTFFIHYQELGVPEPHRIAFTFDESRLDVLAVETLNDDVIRFGGRAL
jgi:hypothetical protein